MKINSNSNKKDFHVAVVVVVGLAIILCGIFTPTWIKRYKHFVQDTELETLSRMDIAKVVARAHSGDMKCQYEVGRRTLDDTGRGVFPTKGQFNDAGHCLLAAAEQTSKDSLWYTKIHIELYAWRQIALDNQWCIYFTNKDFAMRVNSFLNTSSASAAINVERPLHMPSSKQDAPGQTRPMAMPMD